MYCYFISQHAILDALVAKDLVLTTASPVLMAIRMKKAPARVSLIFMLINIV